jgi:hypothetical protein
VAIFAAHLYDKGRNWIAPVGAFESVEGTLRFDDASEFEITVKASHNRLPEMLTPGTRMALFLRGENVCQGPIRTQEGSGPGNNTTFTFGVEDNFRILKNFLVFQVPGGNMAAQSGAYNWTETGNIESVFKHMVELNLGTRGVEPVTVAPNLNRGGTITSSARMATVFNEMFPLLESKGLIAKVTSTPAGLVVDVVEPGTFANKLTESSRIIRKWRYKLEAPDVTNVIVGGGGQGTARVFKERWDAARHTLWGDHIEVFRDARDTSVTATLNDRGDETLFDGAGTTSLEVQLGETKSFKFGGPTGLKVGQIVTAEVANGLVSVTDTLREIEFSWNVDDGLELKGIIGRKVAPIAKVTTAMQRLSGSINKMKASQ